MEFIAKFTSIWTKNPIRNSFSLLQISVNAKILDEKKYEIECIFIDSHMVVCCFLLLCFKFTLFPLFAILCFFCERNKKKWLFYYRIESSSSGWPFSLVFLFFFLLFIHRWQLLWMQRVRPQSFELTFMCAMRCGF